MDGAARLAGIGKPLAGLLIVDEPGLIRDIRAVSPQTMLVYRYVQGKDDPGPNYSGNAKDEAHKAINWRWQHHAIDAPGADYYQWANEWFPSYHPSMSGQEKNERAGRVKWFGEFYAHLVDILEPRGLKTTYGDWYPGSPEPFDWLLLFDSLRHCKGKVVLDYHGYCPFNTDDMAVASRYWALRIMHDMDEYWPDDLKDMPVIYGETSNARGYLPDQSLNLIKQLDTLLLPWRARMKFFAWYEVVNPELPTGWAAYNVSPIFPQIFDYLASQ